ncbi:MAG: OmpA family protein [Spirochaetales bacterium]|nr:OmpA family protein [Spirochaetales bacterium]
MSFVLEGATNMKFFSSIQKHALFCIIITTFIFIPANLFSQQIITLDLGEQYRITERQNLRVRINGSYKGYLFREYRGFLRRQFGNNNHYKGEYYILQDMKRDSQLIAKAVDDVYFTDFLLNNAGYVSIDNKFEVPLHRSFPAFSFDAVSPGDSWIASGTDLIYDSSGDFVTIPFLCRYIYRGDEIYQTRSVSVIDAQYALRYKKDPYDNNRSEINTINGSHKAVIMLYNDEPGGIFIRTDVSQNIGYKNGSLESTTGFILTWYDGISALSVESNREKIIKSLEDIDNEDIILEERDNGLVLQMQNIHFLPDSPVILPEERLRMDVIARLLEEAEGSTFLVVGHTADVGTSESQYELSVDRAKTIVDELVLRGIPSKQFLYRGEGGDTPIASNLTTEGRAQNRRVEITILD